MLLETLVRNPARYMDATRCRKLHDLRTSLQMPTSTAYKPAFRRTPPHAKPPPPPPPRRWTSPLSTLLAVVPLLCRSACGGSKAKAFLNSAGVWPRIVVEDEPCNACMHDAAAAR
jgi:hypothetical protein